MDTIIITPKVGKKRTRKEKRACRERELKQLGSLNPLAVSSTQIGIVSTDVYTRTKKHVSKKQVVKEEKINAFTTLKSINAMMHPEQYKTKMLGNAPISSYAKWSTEFSCQKDKLPASLAQYENKNTRYKFNTGKDMPVKRVSQMSGVKLLSLIEAEKITNARKSSQIYIDNKEAIEKEKDDRIKHELK
jgi:hypothetical protein